MYNFFQRKVSASRYPARLYKLLQNFSSIFSSAPKKWQAPKGEENFWASLAPGRFPC